MPNAGLGFTESCRVMAKLFPPANAIEPLSGHCRAKQASSTPKAWRPASNAKLNSVATPGPRMYCSGGRPQQLKFFSFRRPCWPSELESQAEPLTPVIAVSGGAHHHRRPYWPPLAVRVVDTPPPPLPSIFP